MTSYTIRDGTNQQREAVSNWLHGLDHASEDTRERIITAWISTWLSSPYESLAEMPVARGVDYPLMLHVNEVTRVGLDLAKRASADWNMDFDLDQLTAILLLHDVDKPLMYDRVGSEIENSHLSREIPHGVLGAMLLKELSFSHVVVSTIALHAGNAPYHGETPYAWILHYADYFSADHMLMAMGRKPTYQR